MAARRFIVDARQRARTDYALTSEPILIVSRMFRETVTSLPLAALADVTLHSLASGEGTIVFGRDAVPAWVNADFFGASAQGPRFDRIPNAQAVLELVRQAQRSTS